MGEDLHLINELLANNRLELTARLFLAGRPQLNRSVMQTLSLEGGLSTKKPMVFRREGGGVMHTYGEKQTLMSRWITIIVTIFFVVIVSVTTTQAADEKITGRVVAHYTKMETMEVGDVPGHVLGIAQQSGLMFYSTGEVAKKSATFHFDLMKGKGTFVDYSLYTDKDGSTRFIKAVGTAGPVDDGKKFVIEGTFECIGGTGRYEGFKGTGTFKGERIGEIKTGGDAFYDFTMNCKKP
jgi:hypothetical protein